jgi:predicted Zn finger-like uncharacterized protein
MLSGMHFEPCPKCGAEYRVKQINVGGRDKDHVDCEICGHRLAEWEGATIAVYELIRPGKKPDA